jgi:hypothetical protein
MILPERVLGSSGDDHDRLARLGDRADLLGHVVAQLGDRCLSRRRPTSSGAAAQDDEGAHGLTGGLVVGADDRGLGDRRVRDQRRLDLGRRQAVAGDVHDVVDPAEQPDVAVLVVLGAVAGEVVLRAEAAPVGLLVALRVAPDAAQHRRPRLGEHEVADLLRFS